MSNYPTHRRQLLLVGMRAVECNGLTEQYWAQYLFGERNKRMHNR